MEKDGGLDGRINGGIFVRKYGGTPDEIEGGSESNRRKNSRREGHLES
jgi:hypothetical protein